MQIIQSAGESVKTSKKRLLQPLQHCLAESCIWHACKVLCHCMHPNLAWVVVIYLVLLWWAAKLSRQLTYIYLFYPNMYASPQAWSKSVRQVQRCKLLCPLTILLCGPVAQHVQQVSSYACHSVAAICSECWTMMSTLSKFTLCRPRPRITISLILGRPFRSSTCVHRSWLFVMWDLCSFC